MQVTTVDHPLAQHYLTILRDRTTEPEQFRETTRRLAYTMVMEATRQADTTRTSRYTPNAIAPDRARSSRYSCHAG